MNGNKVYKTITIFFIIVIGYMFYDLTVTGYTRQKAIGLVIVFVGFLIYISGFVRKWFKSRK